MHWSTDVCTLAWHLYAQIFILISILFSLLLDVHFTGVNSIYSIFIHWFAS